MGSTVFGSTINLSNVLYLRVTAVSSENALAQIVGLVESAQLNRAPIQAYADRLATIFTPMVIALAICTFAAWYTASVVFKVVPVAWYAEEFGDPVLFSMLFAISVVVISCPCALGLGKKPHMTIYMLTLILLILIIFIFSLARLLISHSYR